MALLLVAGLIFVNLVLLNALIAIMGDTYDRVSETKVQRGLLKRAEYIIECENRLSSRQQRSEHLFPRWLHVVQQVDRNGPAGRTVAAWSGRVAAIRDEVEARSVRIERKVEATNARIDGLEEANSRIERKLDEVVQLIQLKATPPPPITA